MRIIALLFIWLYAQTLPASGAEVYTIKGRITIETYIQIVETKPTKTVVLDSIGGDLAIAIAISHFIYDHGLSTTVMQDGECYSACTLIFQSGRQRTASVTAKFMYHYATVAERPHLAMTILMKDLLLFYGAHPALLEKIVPGQDVYLEALELGNYDVIQTLMIP